MSTKTLKLTISGRVQGVGFRAFVQEEAGRLGIKGWVRNLGDGQVQALVSGPDVAVEELLGRVHEGPPAARVDDVLALPTGEDPGSGFGIASTA
jgi:acylphosphatase